MSSIELNIANAKISLDQCEQAENLKKDATDWSCHICTNLLIDAHEIKCCGVWICGSCVLQTSTKGICMYCNNSSCIPCPLIRVKNKVLKLLIECPYECESFITVESFLNKSHMETCVQLSILCDSCHLSFFRKNYDSHHQACKKVDCCHKRWSNCAHRCRQVDMAVHEQDLNGHIEGAKAYINDLNTKMELQKKSYDSLQINYQKRFQEKVECIEELGKSVDRSKRLGDKVKDLEKEVKRLQLIEKAYEKSKNDKDSDFLSRLTELYATRESSSKD
ncbi:MAG: hypothetical protein Sylvanvirus31_7 [Sylvanvirus sp.]|uniref:Uncharacterized protein n=1 Tax=Sylvanvirus sp. TaxID=2487774 RepID=A0A3G5AJ30_9VIRU|nr:MAG: hypothetical protein Sylvanvirus31_7 [Sylvanvirus sp.]